LGRGGVVRVGGKRLRGRDGCAGCDDAVTNAYAPACVGGDCDGYNGEGGCHAECAGCVADDYASFGVCGIVRDSGHAHAGAECADFCPKRRGPAGGAS
jgi:hypothetical protein